MSKFVTLDAAIKLAKITKEIAPYPTRDQEFGLYQFPDFNMDINTLEVLLETESFLDRFSETNKTDSVSISDRFYQFVFYSPSIENVYTVYLNLLERGSALAEPFKNFYSSGYWFIQRNGQVVFNYNKTVIHNTFSLTVQIQGLDEFQTYEEEDLYTECTIFFPE